MRNVIATFNTTLDGICDHTAGVRDEELHNYYTVLLNQGDVILYGSITYHLIEWNDYTP